MGLLKAEDWGGAQWIGAKGERPKTIPAELQGMADYSFETRFRILEGSAMVFFRTAYVWNKGYGVEIQPGSPGKFVVTRGEQDKKPVSLKDYVLQDLKSNEWHSLKIAVKGGDFSFWIDDAPVGSEPLHDESSKAGTVALGAGSPDGKSKTGLVQFDDFRLISNGETLVKEDFENPAVFAFQEYFYSNDTYARVKEGCLETRGLMTYLEPKKGLEAPLIRKEFQIQPKKIARARAYVSGLGYYRFWLNGQRVDDYELQPGFARYNKTAYYAVYDLTGRLKPENALGFELGRGWYGMTTPTLWGETFAQDWMAEPALRVLLTIEYVDGTRETVISDPSFQTAPGPILFDSLRAGEIYDARQEKPGWNRVGLQDAGWTPAVLAKGKMPSAAPGLTAQMFEPIRVTEEFSPVKIERVEGEKDAWMIDFGKHMAGTVEMKLAAKPGQEVRLMYVEKINEKDKGRERWNNFNAQATGDFQRDIYVARGTGEEAYQASYSYKGFRYVRVEGFAAQPSLDQFKAKAINSDMAKVGAFTTSSELWNKIWEAGRRTIQSNMHSIPNDCAHEKLGWTCDDAIVYYATAYNYDVRKLYEKRLQDYADDISPNGTIRNVLPSAWAKGEDPAWVGSYVNIVWKHYQTYGDRRVIERHFDNLKLYMATLIKEGQNSEKPPLLTKPRKALGDWVNPEGNIPPEGALIYFNLYFYRYACMMADMAKVVGRTEDESYYSTLAADLKAKFNDYFFDVKEGCYYSTNRSAGFRQSPQAIALAFGIVAEDRKARVVQRLAKDMHDRKDHVWVGILGMEAIADALCENGQSDLAFTAHLQDTGPSLGNMIRAGATTLWEDLSSNPRALNIRIWATPLGWMARYVAGLHVEGILGNGPGFRSAVIEPYVSPAQLTSAQLNFDSPVGRYESHWRVQDNEIVYAIVVPPNATAIARLPLLGKTEITVTESGKCLWEKGKTKDSIEGCGKVKIENDRIVIPLGSGAYSFAVKTPNSPKTTQ